MEMEDKEDLCSSSEEDDHDSENDPVYDINLERSDSETDDNDQNTDEELEGEDETNRRESDYASSCAKKAKYSQKFRPSWLQLPEYKDWLCKRNDMAFCKYCSKILQPKLSVIKLHSQSKQHVENAKPFSDGRTLRTLDTFVEKKMKPADSKIDEAKISLFIAEHCSILTVDHLTELIKQMCPNKEIHLKRTKCTAIIRNAWQPYFFEDLIADIGDMPYSLLLDESTDIATLKMLGVVIRYVSVKMKKLVSTYLAIIQLENGTAEGIVSALNEFIVSCGLNTANCIGIGTDNASVMTGVNNGVHVKLEALWKTRLVLVRCVCHSLQLAVSDACDILPRNLEFLIKETYNWFSHSTLRQTAYQKLYVELYDEVPLKIVKLSQTRWMSRYDAIVRILAQWEVLHQHFDLARTKEKCWTAEILALMYGDNVNYCYMLYLKKILHDVNTLNKTYESNNNPFKLIGNLVSLITSIGNTVINPSVRKNINVLSTNDLQPYLDPKPYFGFSCEAKLNQVALTKPEDPMFVTNFKKRCIDFTLSLIRELKERLPNNYKFLQLMNELTIENALRQVKPEITSLITLPELQIKVDEIDLIETQWTNITFIPWDQEIIRKKDSFMFWYMVYEYEDAAGNKPFHELANFVLKLLSLPLSNADVERVFSTMNVVKSKTRNRMKLPLLNAILSVRFALRRLGETCYTLAIPSKVTEDIGSTKIYGLKEGTDPGDTADTDDYENDFFTGITLMLDTW